MDSAKKATPVPNRNHFRLGEWIVEPTLNKLVGEHEQKHLTPKAMEVLVLLAERAGDVISREDFLETVWNGLCVSDHVVGNAIWELRRAVDDNAQTPRFIATVPKRGYRLLCPVETYGDAPESAHETARVQPAHVQTAHVQTARAKTSPPARTTNPWGRWLAATSLAMLAAFVTAGLANREEPTSIPEPTTPSPESLVIAVLPFENLTGDAEFDWLSTAIPDVLSHELARSRHLHVLDVSQPAGDGMDAESLKRRAEKAQRRGATVLVSGRVTGAAGRLLISSRFEAPLSEPRHFEVEVKETGLLFAELTDKLRLALEIEAADEDTAAISAAGTSSIDAYRHYIEGMLLARHQDHPGALAELHLAIELDPDFALAHGELAHVLDVLGETALAEQAIDRALALSVSRPQAERVGYLRLSARIADDIENELEYLRQMVALKPRDARWIATLAWFQFTHFRQCEEAAVRYRRALDLDPRPDLYAYLGETLMACERPAEALEAVETALQLNPGAPETWRFLGNLRRLTGDFEGASVALDRAEHLAPQRAGTAYTRAQLLADEQRFDEALEALHRFRGLVTGANLERDAWITEGDIYLKTGDLHSAARAVNSALALEPAPRAWWMAGLVAIELGLLDEAHNHLAQLEQHFEQRPSRYGLAFLEHLRGEILLLRGRPGEAAEAFEAALQARPLEQARFRLSLAEARKRAGDPAEANRVLHRLLEIQPSHGEARCLAAATAEPDGDGGGGRELAQLGQLACEPLLRTAT